MANVPKLPGVYELKCFGELVYIGHSSDLLRRLLRHLSDWSPNGYRFQVCHSFRSSEYLENHHLNRYVDRYGKLPTWNKSDTHPPNDGFSEMASS